MEIEKLMVMSRNIQINQLRKQRRGEQMIRQNFGLKRVSREGTDLHLGVR